MADGGACRGWGDADLARGGLGQLAGVVGGEEHVTITNRGA
jgi:hypothetical protein